jgi:hypothetical protein
LNRRVRRLRSGRLDLTTVEVRRGESHTTHVENDKATACFLDRKVYIGTTDIGLNFQTLSSRLEFLVYLKYLYPNMAAKSPVMLLLGFGPNVGHHVSEAFAAKGYIVARASRKIKEEESTATQINIPIDLSDPESVIGVFSKLKDTHGFPSVVVYNGTSSFH